MQNIVPLFVLFGSAKMRQPLLKEHIIYEPIGEGR